MSGEPAALVRRRARDLGVAPGHFEPGPWNAITDVAGVRVGHSTIIHGSGRRADGSGVARTGVTAVLPCADVFHERVFGGTFTLNGAGEVSGLTQVQEWGIIETPILLTNTLAVGTVARATVEWMLDKHPGIGKHHDVVIPLVGECDDSWLNDIAAGHVRPEHVVAALESASAGPVAEGSVGGGTGMITCDLKAGIGTSSRRLPESMGGWTLGVLVMSNFGRLEDLRLDGVPIGRTLAARGGLVGPERRPLDGSIIAVFATDAPLLSHQLNRVAKRVALGIGRVGSYAAHGSGEIVLGFSTRNRVPRDHQRSTFDLTVTADRAIDPLYQAAVEATEEAILNALCAASPMTLAAGREVNALPLEEVRVLMARALAALTG